LVKDLGWEKEREYLAGLNTEFLAEIWEVEFIYT